MRDYARLREAWKARNEEEASERPGLAGQKPTDTQIARDRAATSLSAGDKTLQQLRRFHLTRHLSSLPSGGTRRQKIDIRPPLATFVERRTVSLKHENNPIYQGHPIDKVIDLHHEQNGSTKVADGVETPSLDALQSSERTPIKPFVVPEARSKREGTSIQDHPSTWDHESDQLADELAALAMEFDPEIRSKAVELEASRPKSPPPPAAPDDSDRMVLDDNDFVYETYIKVQHEQGGTPLTDDWGVKVGVLVIDEEDEDLWNKYVDSDQEDEWDEEDSNGESKLCLHFSLQFLHTNPPIFSRGQPCQRLSGR